jgi:hypothetical protein
MADAFHLMPLIGSWFEIPSASVFLKKLKLFSRLA